MGNDNQDLLWIGTNVGLNVYIPTLEKFLTVPLMTRSVLEESVLDAMAKFWFSGLKKSLFVCELLIG